MSVSTRCFLAGLALVPLLGAITLANAATLTVDGAACGNYGQVTVNATGNIVITGVTGSCTIGAGGGETGGGETGGGETGGGETGGGETGGGEAGGGETGGGETGGGETGGGESQPDGIYGSSYMENLVVKSATPNANRIASKNEYKAYAFRLDLGGFTSGSYSTVSWYGTSYRTMFISDELGTQKNLPGCYTRVGAEGTLRWQVGAGAGCSLEAGKTYYLNVKPYQECTTATANNCSFTLSGQAKE